MPRIITFATLSASLILVYLLLVGCVQAQEILNCWHWEYRWVTMECMKSDLGSGIDYAVYRPPDTCWQQERYKVYEPCDSEEFNQTHFDSDTNIIPKPHQPQPCPPETATGDWYLRFEHEGSDTKIRIRLDTLWAVVDCVWIKREPTLYLRPDPCQPDTVEVMPPGTWIRPMHRMDTVGGSYFKFFWPDSLGQWPDSVFILKGED